MSPLHPFAQTSQASSSTRSRSQQRRRRSTRSAERRALSVDLTPSDDKSSKWMVTFTDERGSYHKVHFGQANASDFTKHQDPKRMARYVRRHGGRLSAAAERLMREESSLCARLTPRAYDAALIRTMDRIRESDKEDWTLNGVATPGFWSRWLTWSRPTLQAATQLMRKRFGLRLHMRK